MIGVGVSLAQAFSPTPGGGPVPLSVVAAPGTVTWGGVFEQWVPATQPTATPSGGTGPYTLLWEIVSDANDPPTSIDDDANPTPFIFNEGPVTPSGQTVVKCTATDAVLATAVSNFVTIG
jgi:hypothetical protein